MKKFILALLGAFTACSALAQGTLSGDLMTNVNYYQRDSGILTPENTLYNDYLSGGESWLSLRYNYKGFTAFVRADAFHNSNLYDPKIAISGFGIGAWSLSKDIKGLTATAGFIYDQIGSGVLFRAYEDRGLLIDNALVGLHLKYQLNDHIMLKGFTGQQKNVRNFTRYNPIIKGLNAEGDFSLGDKVHITPGIGALNRTMDNESWLPVKSRVDAQDTTHIFYPRYNTYAFTAYNNLTAGDFSWYIEGAYKTHEAIEKDNLLQDLDGNVVYSTLGYAKKGMAINLTGKRTQNFMMRTSPNEQLLRGLMNWQPIVARLRPQRLLARYTPASQDLSELALGADVLLSPNDNLDVTLNYTHINTLEEVKLYREAYAEFNYRGLEKWIFMLGAQYLEYNQKLYQVKDVPLFTAFTPFVEATYKFNDKTSIRTEWEYMFAENDFGSWIFGLVELNIAPKWSIAVSDMYITKLNVHNPSGLKDPAHYYNIFGAYTKGPHRFTVSYVKQVDGINCTGGVCRYEPAFSGFKLGITSSF
ncbi:MAG TPA: DUF6029 family protein [Flavipsychrobacter sp.]|nr:DUF6029 family protein [Flavipsychrobacter sp.]